MVSKRNVTVNEKFDLRQYFKIGWTDWEYNKEYHSEEPFLGLRIQF
jgi:hypothetical protein